MRNFLIRNLTPAKARKLIMASIYANLGISEAVQEIAKQDSNYPISETGSPIDHALRIHIGDFDNRAVIPYRDKTKLPLIVSTILSSLSHDDKVILIDSNNSVSNIIRNITGEDIHDLTRDGQHKFEKTDEINFDINTMLGRRNSQLVISSNDFFELSQYKNLGKLFPRIIVIGEQITQYGLALSGSQHTYESDSIRSMATIISPRLVSQKRRPGVRLQNVYALWGVFTRYIGKENSKKIMRRWEDFDDNCEISFQ